MKLCIKCGTEGHTNRNCREPVTSYGVIVYRRAKEGEPKGRLHPFSQMECKRHVNPPNFHQKPCKEGELLFYLVERKDTIGFLNIVQGNYDTVSLQKSISALTCEERWKLQHWSFEELWTCAGTKKKDMQRCKYKFEQTVWAEILDQTQCHFREADYLIPKGRLVYHESAMECALREATEESGYAPGSIELLRLRPYEETFTGTDSKLYRNVYFIGRLKDDAKVAVNLGEDAAQSKEVQNMAWLNITECLTLIRDYHENQKAILSHAHKCLTDPAFQPIPVSLWAARSCSYSKICRSLISFRG